MHSALENRDLIIIQLSPDSSQKLLSSILAELLTALPGAMKLYDNSSEIRYPLQCKFPIDIENGFASETSEGSFLKVNNRISYANCAVKILKLNVKGET
ncbi:hypothetical protein CDAR_587701 [Caerostris darwini]|uniref:Uncharacterized protein n=1 Tax=Caerostris darwini TaxID=1538125 RepID=A0AAV4SMY5_9ARAC|nr:hypothetical protein CDAR_587701 [Caerostris darwini]